MAMIILLNGNRRTANADPIGRPIKHASMSDTQLIFIESNKISIRSGSSEIIRFLASLMDS